MKSRIIVLVVIFTLFGGVILYGNYSSKNKIKNTGNIQDNISGNNKANNTNENDSIDKTIADGNNVNSAVSSMDVNKCEEISDSKMKEHCFDLVYATKAGYNNDITMCDKIIDESLKKECIDKISVGNAMKSEKKEDCEKIVGNEPAKKECLKIAILKEVGTVGFNGTKDICNKLDGADKTTCLSQINKQVTMKTVETAIQKKDINACNSITDTALKTQCIQSITLENAMNTTDINACNSIIDTQNKQYCISQVKKNQDAQTFQKSSTSTDIKTCNSISDTETKTQCIEGISIKNAIANKDVNSCNNITDSTEKQKCINTINALISVSKK